MSDELGTGLGAPAAPAALNEQEIQKLKEKIVEVVRSCYDPEIPVNIYDLGLIYDFQVEPSGKVRVQMTLTAPGCPAAGTLPGEVEDKISLLPNVKDVEVKVVWDPPWSKDRMSEAAKLQLGFL
jgi:FeS assembly SUF system protein